MKNHIYHSNITQLDTTAVTDAVMMRACRTCLWWE